MNIHSSFIGNSHNQEASQMSLDLWMVKQIMEYHLYCGILVNNDATE
jgi:hypothetical protein